MFERWSEEQMWLFLRGGQEGHRNDILFCALRSIALRFAIESGAIYAAS
jgi:hypothetical protein